MVGEGRLCSGHDVLVDEDGTPDVRNDVGCGRDLQDGPPVDGGGVIVHIQLDENTQVGPGYRSAVRPGSRRQVSPEDKLIANTEMGDNICHVGDVRFGTGDDDN